MWQLRYIATSTAARHRASRSGLLGFNDEARNIIIINNSTTQGMFRQSVSIYRCFG